MQNILQLYNNNNSNNININMTKKGSRSKKPKRSSFLKSLYGQDTNWKQTSYNTINGIHTLGGTPFRKNHAGINYTYDSQRDAFIPIKPYNSWVLNEDTCNWESPITKPQDGNMYRWNESIINWELLI